MLRQRIANPCGSPGVRGARLLRRKWWRQQSQLFSGHVGCLQKWSFFSTTAPHLQQQEPPRQATAAAPAVNRTDWIIVVAVTVVLSFFSFLFQHVCVCLKSSVHEMHAEARSNSIKVFSEHEAALWWHPLNAVFFPRGFGSWQLQKPRPNPRPRLNPRPRPKHCLGPLVPPSPAWTCRRPTRQGLRHQGVAQHPPGPWRVDAIPYHSLAMRSQSVCWDGPWSAGPLRAVLCDAVCIVAIVCILMWLIKVAIWFVHVHTWKAT